MNIEGASSASLPISPAPSAQGSSNNNPSDQSSAGKDKSSSQHSPSGFTNMSMHTGMSTQDSLCLHNQVNTIEPMCKPDMDLQKLMELMMAIKLLEAISEKGTTFSCVA